MTLREQTLYAARAWTDRHLARRIASLDADPTVDVDGLVVLRALREESAARRQRSSETPHPKPATPNRNRK